MNTILKLGVAAVLGLAPSLALADGYTKGDLKVESPWVRTTIPDRPAAGYMIIRNAGDAADAIVSASSPKMERIELHTHLMEDGVMKMREIDKIEVPAKGSAELKTGGLHLMLFGAKEPLKEGETLPITVVFEKAGPLEMEFAIKPVAGGKKTRGSH